MPIQLTIGLAPKKVSYFDTKSKLYLTLDQPFKTLTLQDDADLSGLARGLFTLQPAIVLLEGAFPEQAKEDFKNRYKQTLQVFGRADMIVTNAPKAPAAPVEPVIPPVEDPNPEVGNGEISGMSVDQATLFEPEAPAPKKTAAKKTTAKKTEA